MKSYKHKKHVDDPKEDWLIFENTHEPIVTQQIDIYYRSDAAASTAIADSMKYDKKRKAA